MALRIKRLRASISAGIEEVVGKLENHEAVADCLLQDLRSDTAQIRVQQNRVDSQAERTAEQLREAEADEARWNQRALALAESDEPKALQCLERAQHSHKLAETLSQQLHAHQTTIDELGATIVEMESKLADLTLKRATLSSRELRAGSSRTAAGCQNVDTANQLFDRWEASVMTDEYVGELRITGGHVVTDVLDREFSAVENQTLLKEKLQALKLRELANSQAKNVPKDDGAAA